MPPRNTRNTRKKEQKKARISRKDAKKKANKDAFASSNLSIIFFRVFRVFRGEISSFHSEVPCMEAIHIVGAGGIGCAVGYALAESGPVVFVETSPEKIAHGRRFGV